MSSIIYLKSFHLPYTPPLLRFLLLPNIISLHNCDVFVHFHESVYYETDLVCKTVVLVFLTKLPHRLGTANSTANLLDDVEGNPCGKMCMSPTQLKTFCHYITVQWQFSCRVQMLPQTSGLQYIFFVPLSRLKLLIRRRQS